MTGVNIIAFRRFSQMDVSGNVVVNTSTDHINTLKVGSSTNSLLLKNYQAFFSLRITLPLESTSSLTSPQSSHLPSVIITTLIIHHPIILPFQTQNFPISQILPSIDIWHLFGLLYGFFSVSVFSSFQLSLFPSV